MPLLKPDQPLLLGALTIGKLWEFARLDRASKQIDQGLESYRVPEDLEFLIRILVEALALGNASTSVGRR